MPPALAELVLVAEWNNQAAVERAFREYGDDLAAVICEPVNYNSGCLPPRPGFLAFLREISARHGAVLIFDEVLSGFRTGTACVQGPAGSPRTSAPSPKRWPTASPWPSSPAARR